MASARINKFENIPLFQRMALQQIPGNGSLQIQGVYIPGSLSFNTVALMFSAQGTTAKTATISFGLYSLTGSTLSLANSASQSTNPTANQLSWVTLVTSATQDITPGNWYLAIMSSSSSNSRMSFICNTNAGDFLANGVYGGVFVRGFLSVSTSALPASIATSDLSKEGSGFANAAYLNYPYILISA